MVDWVGANLEPSVVEEAKEDISTVASSGEAAAGTMTAECGEELLAERGEHTPVEILFGPRIIQVGDSPSLEDCGAPRQRAATEGATEGLVVLERELSDGNYDPCQATEPSPEWDADWNAVAGKLEPQCFRIGFSTEVRRPQRRRTTRLSQKRVVTILGEETVYDLVAKTNSECCARRMGSRTVSNGYPSRRRSVGGQRPRVRTDSVYDLDWFKIAPAEV